jgi:hypothetical protein
MRLTFTILALSATLASGQNVILHFAHTNAKQDINEITTVIRTIADI